MVLFQVDIQKQQGTEYWTNRYIIDETDLTAAATKADLIPGFEQLFHTTNVTLESYRVRPLAPGGDMYIIVPLGANGLYAGGDLSSQLPLFNCVRVDLAVTFGRPSRKYYRSGLTEAMVVGSSLDATYRTVVIDAMDDMRAALAPSFVDVDNQAIVNSQVYVPVQMRQLRRGSRRRTEPII